MCSDLHQDPVVALELYYARVRIETMFDMLKNVMGVFRYRFWKSVIANLLLLDLFSSAPKGIIREIQKYRFKKKMLNPGVLKDKQVSDPETILSKLENPPEKSLNGHKSGQ